MLVLGLLLILAAVAVGAGAIYDGGESATFELFGQTIGTTISGVFVAGLATMLLLLLGFWMLFASAGRARRKRAERKQARLRQRESVSQMEEERAQLRAENERLADQLAAREAARRDAADTTLAGEPTAGSAASADGYASDGYGDSRVVDGRAEHPRHVEGDRVVDQNTDLTAREERAGTTAGRSGDGI